MQCLRTAIAIAQQQEAKFWELRVATCLARLWARQAQRADARDLLAPVYDWFNEGLDTLDLKQAKSLLDACSDARRSGVRRRLRE